MLVGFSRKPGGERAINYFTIHHMQSTIVYFPYVTSNPCVFIMSNTTILCKPIQKCWLNFHQVNEEHISKS